MFHRPGEKKKKKKKTQTPPSLGQKRLHRAGARFPADIPKTPRREGLRPAARRRQSPNLRRSSAPLSGGRRLLSLPRGGERTGGDGLSRPSSPTPPPQPQSPFPPFQPRPNAPANALFLARRRRAALRGDSGRQRPGLGPTPAAALRPPEARGTLRWGCGGGFVRACEGAIGGPRLPAVR